MAKKNEAKETCSDCVVTDPINESPLKRLSEFTQEKKMERVAEEMVSGLGASLYDVDVVIKDYIIIMGDSFRWAEITLQNPTIDGQYIRAMTNSPQVIEKLGKVKAFPVLAKITRREVRKKFRYDIQ